MMFRHAVILFAGMHWPRCVFDNPAIRALSPNLEQVEADTDEVYLTDSLQRAAQSYRSYLEETSEGTRTPEAMRRLADLQIEQEYGVIGGAQLVELPTPDTAAVPAGNRCGRSPVQRCPAEPAESDQQFEKRASKRQTLLSGPTQFDIQAPWRGD